MEGGATGSDGTGLKINFAISKQVFILAFNRVSNQMKFIYTRTLGSKTSQVANTTSMVTGSGVRVLYKNKQL